VIPAIVHQVHGDKKKESGGGGNSIRGGSERLSHNNARGGTRGKRNSLSKRVTCARETDATSKRRKK